ncbi:MAG: hypothetical protein KKA90_01055 [Nanoarchaeota archaeon]|nr:hypothetical protein [Nanoarchaeota archaeon]
MAARQIATGVFLLIVLGIFVVLHLPATAYVIADQGPAVVDGYRVLSLDGGSLILGYVTNNGGRVVEDVNVLVVATGADDLISYATGAAVRERLASGEQVPFRVFLPNIKNPTKLTLSVQATTSEHSMVTLPVVVVRNGAVLEGFVQNTQATAATVQVAGAFFDAAGDLVAVGVTLVGSVPAGAYALFELVPVGTVRDIVHYRIAAEAI